MQRTATNLKIGIVVGSVSRNAGGLFESVRRSAIVLEKLGLNITVYSIRDEFTSSDIAAWGKVQVKVFDSFGPGKLGFVPELTRQLIRDQIDVVHLHGIWQFISRSVLKWREKTGRPVVISPRGMLDEWALRNSKLKKKVVASLFEGKNLEGASVIHALNSSESASIRSFGLTNPIAEIANGADVPDLSPTPARPPWHSASKKTLLFLARLHPKKGISELLKAWSILERECPSVSSNWQLVIAGWDDGGHANSLTEEARSLKLESVSFPGAVFGELKRQALFHADAFILPSYSEGLPIGVLEAWAYSLPVFMTKHCNLSHAFIDGAAIEVETNPDKLADILSTHLEENSLLKVSERGNSLVRKKYAWSSIGTQLERLYEWCANEGETSNIEFLSHA